MIFLHFLTVQELQRSKNTYQFAVEKTMREGLGGQRSSWHLDVNAREGVREVLCLERSHSGAPE